MSDCSGVRSRLDELMDGELSEPIRRAVRMHLEACVECRTALALRERLRDATRDLPREMPPARDLWPGVAAAIERGRARAIRPGPHWLAVAAGLVAVVGLALVVARSGQAPRVAHEPPATGAMPAMAVRAEPWPGEMDLDRVELQLREALEAVRPRLAPETLRVIDENLRIIDDALGRMKDALDKDPGNRDLFTLLTATHRQKIDLLRTATELSQRT